MKNNKIFKSLVAITTVFIITMICVITTKTKALDTFNVSITFQVDNQSDVTLAAATNEGEVANNTAGTRLIGHRGEANSIINFVDTSNNNNFNDDSVSVTCTSNKQCSATVTVPNEHGVKVVVGGGTPFKFKIGENDYNDSPISTGTTLTIINEDNPQQAFDGKAYLIWSCSNGGTCYHYFDNISTTDAMFIKENTIKDDNTNEQFDVHATTKGFALKKDFEDWQTAYKTYKNITSITWSSLDAKYVLEGENLDMRVYEEQAINAGACSKQGVSQETFESCVDDYVTNTVGIFHKACGLRPVGEPTLNNAYVSYGDRNFKVTIYNNDYRGISLGALDDLEYYPPSFTDGLTRIESYDISGSSPSNPVDIDTVLLEPTVNIKALTAYNLFDIASIVALNVPPDAVSISKVNGEYKITFSSNYYDSVVFKITSTNNEPYYLRINRRTLSLNDRIGIRQGQGPVDINVDFYFDRNTNWDDYTITGTVEYKNGTNKIVEFTNTKRIDDGLGNITTAWEVDLQNPPMGPAGKGLKQANYKYTFQESEALKIKKVYVNAEFKGSTATNYKGAFAGHGKGFEVTFEEGV